MKLIQVMNNFAVFAVRATLAARRGTADVVQVSSEYSQNFLDIMGIDTRVEHREAAPTTPCLMVANHQSYADIMILSALAPVVFVTSRELEHMQPLGFFAKVAKSIFVERRNFSTLQSDIEKIEAVLRSGISVCFFPEATSTDGRLLQFRSSLYEAAVRANVPVQPIAIDFTHLDDLPVDTELLKRICYYGKAEFFDHLHSQIRHTRVDVKVTFLAQISGNDRKVLCRESRDAIRNCLAETRLDIASWDEPQRRSQP